MLFNKALVCKGIKKRSSKKTWFDKEFNEARKCLMSLDVVNDKEKYKIHLHGTRE
mgnify:CR=1 FL=1